MDFSVNEEILLIKFVDRIDSSSAPEIEKELDGILDANAHGALTLDFEKTVYVSSAGLRVLLRLMKREKQFKVINVSSEVYEILEMTGFTEMADITKAYRSVSIDGCEVIGNGANGKVYRLDADTIIKVYKNADSLPEIQRERELARKAFVLGVPTAIPYDVVRVNDSFGSVFELLNADSFAKLFINDPDNFEKYTEIYVDILKKIHSTEVKPGDMPKAKDYARSWVKFLKGRIDDKYCEKLEKLIEDVPDSNMMIHGDYHIKNVMMQNDEALIIDMDTIGVGNPIFEFQGIYLAYCGFSEIDNSAVEGFLGIKREVSLKLWRRTLELYFGTQDDESITKIEEKAKTLAYARLLRREYRHGETDPEKSKMYAEYYKNHLYEMLDRVDSVAL